MGWLPLRCCSGKVYYEVEVTGAQGTIDLRIGFIGSNFKSAASGGLLDVSWCAECRAGNGDWAHRRGEHPTVLSTYGDCPRLGFAAPLRVGDVVGVACDIEAGTMHMSVNGVRGNCTATVFSGGVRPDRIVGSGLIPLVCGLKGCTVAGNMGQAPFKFPAPFESRGYASVISCVRQRIRSTVRNSLFSSLQPKNRLTS